MKPIRTAATPSDNGVDSSGNKNSQNEDCENKKNELSFHADLIRAVGMFLVILLHSAVEPHPIVTVPDQAEVIRWWTVTIYDTLSQPGVPLFVLISGALLLQPYKKEPLKVFLKKRINRIALPFLFWSAVYFVYRFAVLNEILTVTSIIHGLQTGAFYHFWFIYMIFGIYLITPFLRLVIANASRSLLKYGLVLWFFATGIIPVIGLFDSNILGNRVFLHLEWVGYFVLGYYLLKTKIKPRYIYTALFGGIIYTLIATYLIQLTLGGAKSFFFAEPETANMIVISTAMFLLLRNVSATKFQNRFPKITKLVRLISQNTLPIYLMHIIVLETFQNGYLGIQISVNTLTPAWEIPVLAVIALFICLGIALGLKKIPILRKMIG
ncbi:MAG: acyltransferase family protein [Candidatus Bathyarchaeota archaeon]|nr:acyltransferase family protein [Candidatus Bathyarchaeum sp.]